MCLLTQSQLPLNHSQPIVSTRSFLRPPEMGLFSAGSSAKNFLRESRSTFIAREPKLFPLPSFLSWRPPSANTAGDARLFAPLASRERSTTMPLGAPSSKGSARYYVGPGSLVSQSPFSSNFCKLFCIFSNFIMLAVSSRQRTSTFNCTCDPRLDGAVCSV